MKDKNKNKEVPSQEKLSPVEMLREIRKIKDELCYICKYMVACNETVRRYYDLIEEEAERIEKIDEILDKMYISILEEIE